MRPSSASRRARGVRTGAGRVADVMWQVAEEVPVAVAANGRQRAVMLATPADLEDFATGFALTEGLVTEIAAIEAVTVTEEDEGIVVDLAVDPARLAEARVRRRAMEGRTSCGLCGVESLADVARATQRRATRTPVAPGAVLAAFAALPDHQPLNALCRSVHAAAWAGRDGRIAFAREDVGRHNALDKLLGALARERVDPASGFVVMSSRCSFELVQKSALCGIDTLATVSAPTGLALDVAAAAGMTLVALAGDEIVIFDNTRAEAAA